MRFLIKFMIGMLQPAKCDYCTHPNPLIGYWCTHCDRRIV